jgi:hypothetical protein
MTAVFQSQRNAWFQAVSGSGTKADPIVPGTGGPAKFENKRNQFIQAQSGSGTKADPYVLAAGDISWL